VRQKTVSGWNFDPFEISMLALIGAAYWRRARTLARRGRPVPRLRLVAFAAGLATLFVALESPIDTIGEEHLFSVHMLQHLLLGDVAALLLVLGLDGPLLRPLLRFRLVHRLRVLAHPLVALPLWAANFVVWHLPFLFDAALRSDWIHALQHTSFVFFGMLMWAALIESLPGPAWFTAAWKIPYVLGVWLVMLVLSQVFIWSNHAYYAPYTHDATLWGLSHLADQKAGGGVMLVESMLTMLPALVWTLLLVLQESEARQQLLDAGVAPATATRAARYGRT
jgi:putative membrane protein